MVEPLVTGPVQRCQLDHAQRHPSPIGRGRHPLKVVKVAPPKLWLSRDKAAFGYGDQVLLSKIPDDAWRYQLGNKSAMEWVVDQYKDRRPQDPTIRAQFDTYRIADHLEEVTELLAKVITISVETMVVVDRLANSSPLNPASSTKAVHQASAPATPQAIRQLLFDFNQPAEPLPPPATVTLALTREESDFYLLHYQGPHDGDALECLMQQHGQKWDARVQEYGVTQYWQGIKAAMGSWISSLVLTPL